ncbi:hypothetical protein VI817_007054 [Penicillium citrinum]|nr:hypothetical protein VI817_007054 [Penicillium citrinum]
MSERVASCKSRSRRSSAGKRPSRGLCAIMLIDKARRGWGNLMPQVVFFRGDFKLFSELVQEWRNIAEVAIRQDIG